jgi:hypothetical protein
MILRAACCLLLILAVAGSPVRAQEYLWCFGQDEVSFQFDPDNHLLSITHLAAMYNCCPEPVSYDVVMGDGLITVTEVVGADPPCDCICCFELKVDISEIPAGFWTVEFVWLNEEDFQWYTEGIQVVVPGVVDTAELLEVDHQISDCLEASSVPDPPAPFCGWGRLKALYR